jgi:uncharacterized protein YqgV (UPF0045/DUF77 family)
MADIRVYVSMVPLGQHGKSHDVVADAVMQRVAGDMGLISSAELLLLQDRAGIQSS